MLEAGFIFWGLFLSFGLIVGGYLSWMYAAERGEAKEGPESGPGTAPDSEVQPDGDSP